MNVPVIAAVIKFPTLHLLIALSTYSLSGSCWIMKKLQFYLNLIEGGA